MDKHILNLQELESINSSLFDSFDPEQELWIIGGSTIKTTTSVITYTPGHPDGAFDFDISWT
jgi:hypothetical protein